LFLLELPDSGNPGQSVIQRSSEDKVMRQQLPATVQIRTNQDAFLFPATARKAVALSESRARSARLSCAPPGCGGKEAAGAELHRGRKLRNRALPRIHHALE